MEITKKNISFLAFFEGEIDGGVSLAGGVPGDGLVGARVGRLHATDLQPHQVKHLALILRKRHLLSLKRIHYLTSYSITETLSKT